MVDFPMLIEWIRFFANLFSMSIAFGLVTIVLLTPRRDAVTYAFIAFAFTLFLWSMIIFMRFSPLNDYVPATLTMHILIILLFVKAASFYAFVLYILDTLPQWVRYLNYFGVLFSGMLVFLLFSGNILTAVSDDTFTYTISDLGYIALGIIVAYLMVTLYLLSQTTEQNIRLLRVPAFLLIIAYAVNAIPALNNIPIDTFLTMLAVIWVGLLVIQRHHLNPLKQLNADLAQTNRNLKKAITDLEREKKRVDALNDDLARTSRYKSEFMATMSHELRTPLNSIIGYSELLQTNVYGELNADQQDRLERIHRNGQHLSRLINAVLDLNRMDAGQVDLEVRPVDVNQLVQQVHDQYQHHAEEKQLAFVLDVAPNLPPVPADYHRLQQVLINIVDNAIKFTEKGKVTLQANRLNVVDGVGDVQAMPTRGWLRDGQWLLLSITDTGIGIPPEMQAVVFDRFYQVDSGHNRQHDGIGLGLAIVTRIVEMHEGGIWLSSRPDEGTTIFVAIPFSRNKF